MLPAGSNMDPLLDQPNIYQISKWNYLPMYEQIYNDDALFNCDSYSGVRPVQIYGGVDGPKSSDTIFATAPFMADTSPYYSDSRRKLKSKKSKKSKSKSKSSSEDAEEAEMPEKKMELIMCGFYQVKTVDEIVFD